MKWFILDWKILLFAIYKKKKKKDDSKSGLY